MTKAKFNIDDALAQMRADIHQSRTDVSNQLDPQTAVKGDAEKAMGQLAFDMAFDSRKCRIAIDETLYDVERDPGGRER